jgi:hypothetical protein
VPADRHFNLAAIDGLSRPALFALATPLLQIQYPLLSRVPVAIRIIKEWPLEIGSNQQWMLRGGTQPSEILRRTRGEEQMFTYELRIDDSVFTVALRRLSFKGEK